MSVIAASSSSAEWRRRSCELLIAALMSLAGACHEQAPPSVCADIGHKSVCWRGDIVELVPRALPDTPAPLRGFRCSGQGNDRVCEDRARNGGAFECGTTRCLQERPRMPDDGEWECVELSGVVYCHSRGPAAGVALGPMDRGWLCGPRRGASDGERICVDLDPDRPEPASHRQCRFELHHGMQRRSCTPADAPIAGDACSDATRCPLGTRCEAGVCLPARPEPACWLDRDCGDGLRCMLGTCAKAGA